MKKYILVCVCLFTAFSVQGKDLNKQRLEGMIHTLCSDNPAERDIALNFIGDIYSIKSVPASCGPQLISLAGVKDAKYRDIAQVLLKQLEPMGKKR